MNGEQTQDQGEEVLLFIRQNDPKDGYAELRVAADKSAVMATFYPPSPGGEFLTYHKVTQKIDEMGINTGLMHDVIQDAILKTNTTRQPVKNCLIAKSSVPISEVPEHYLIRADLLERKPEIDPSAARIDWHSISAFSIVQAKEPIARRIAKVDGVPGVDVYGEETPFPIKKTQVFSAGKHIVEHEMGLFAGKSGRLSIDSKGVISIEEVLILKNGVDFTTGNITFPGDVILQNKVADGFKIYAGGSIISSEVFDVTEVVCKKDLQVQSGIEGRNKGVARIGGNLIAKYIQNCRVAVRGDVIVSGSIIQSTVYSMGSIKMGQTGKLVGCECIVIGDVQALDIGNPRGARTRIRCGTDFTVQQELDIANEQLKLLTLKIQKTEEVLQEEPLPEIAKHLEELKIKRDEIRARIPQYLPKIDTNENAKIEVYGTIYPGTEIEICHVPISIKKAEKQVILTLDKQRGTIICEPMKKSEPKKNPQKKEHP